MRAISFSGPPVTPDAYVTDAEARAHVERRLKALSLLGTTRPPKVTQEDDFTYWHNEWLKQSPKQSLKQAAKAELTALKAKQAETSLADAFTKTASNANALQAALTTMGLSMSQFAAAFNGLPKAPAPTDSGQLAVACTRFRPYDSSLVRCTCGMRRDAHSAESMKAWMLATSTQGRRRR